MANSEDPILMSLVRRPFPPLDAKALLEADPGCEQLYARLRKALAEAGVTVRIAAPVNHPLAAIVDMALMDPDNEPKQ